MEKYITEIVIGIYTIFNIIVFFIQKSQLDKQKGIISTMESFVGIFNVDEVKKYVEMRKERIDYEATQLIINSDKFRKMQDELIESSIKPIQENYKGILEDKFEELYRVLFDVIMSQEDKLRESFINDLLPKNKDVFMLMINDLNNVDNSNS